MSSTPPPPRRIGKYEVLDELGHGGMAVVYRAKDPQLLREVAVKVLHPHLSKDSESRRRFLREARAAARLRHPNIVEVYDFSPDDGADSFMVSELLEGPTLRRFAEAHPNVPAEAAAAIGVVLCDALECAHGQGVVHRDVKPDNILLQRDGTPKLTDFGIAHVADGEGMTMTGQMLGSPAHMAPEQIEGGKVDARTDLFAAGTVLYALAVGRLPFDAATPHALLRKILDTDYPDPVRVAPAAGHRFAAIMRKCLAREPDDRYPDAPALRDALTNFVAECGIDDPRAMLTEYLADPEGFAEQHKARLLRELPALGARARSSGSIPDALGYFNRALALDPTNQRVLGLVRGIARRKRIERMARTGATVAAIAVATVGVVFGAVRALREKPRGRAETIALRVPSMELPPVVPSATAVPTASAEPSVVASATPSASGRPSARIVGPTARPSASAPPAATRAVQLVLFPERPRRYYIDDVQQRDYAGPDTTVQLTDGVHRFRLIPIDNTCPPVPFTAVVTASTTQIRHFSGCTTPATQTDRDSAMNNQGSAP